MPCRPGPCLDRGCRPRGPARPGRTGAAARCSGSTTWWKRPRAGVGSGTSAMSCERLVTLSQLATTARAAHYPLALAEPEHVDHEVAAEGGVRHHQVQVVDAPHRHPCARPPLRPVAERRALALRGGRVLDVPEDLHRVPLGGHEAVGAAVAEVAVGPAAAEARRLDRRHPALQRLRAAAAPGDVPERRPAARQSASANDGTAPRSRGDRPSRRPGPSPASRGGRGRTPGCRRGPASAAPHARDARRRGWARALNGHS